MRVQVSQQTGNFRIRIVGAGLFIHTSITTYQVLKHCDADGYYKLREASISAFILAMNSSALSSIPFSGNNSSLGFHFFAGIQLDTAIGSLKSLSTYTTALRFFLNRQPLFRRMKKTRESLSRRFFPGKRLSEVAALYLVWSLALDLRSLFNLAVKLFQALLAGKSLILR